MLTQTVKRRARQAGTIEKPVPVQSKDDPASSSKFKAMVL